MKNIKKEILTLILLLLPIAITIMAMFILPDTIPIHFNANGEITRFGSKYENFINLIAFISVGILLKLYSNHLRKTIKSTTDYKIKIDSERNKNVVDYINIVILIIFNIINIYLLLIQYYYSINSYTSFEFDTYKFISIIISILIIIIGNIIPKSKPNSFIGIRTFWSVKNDLSWSYSQRYGGVTLILCGIFIIVGSFF